MSYLGPLGRSSHFRAEKERGRTPSPAWAGTGEAVAFICYNGGQDGHFCGIIIPSLRRVHTQTPLDNFSKGKYLLIFIRRNMCHRKLANPSSFQNRCIYLLSRLMTSVLIFLKHLHFSTNNESSKHSNYVTGGQENYLQREMSLEIKML